jgi:hypothetical protein
VANLVSQVNTIHRPHDLKIRKHHEPRRKIIFRYFHMDSPEPLERRHIISQKSLWEGKGHWKGKK